MAKSVQTLKTDVQRRFRIAGGSRLLFQLGLTRMACHRIDVFAAEASFHRTVITTRMARLITRVEGIMDVSLDPKGFASDRMNNGMAVAPQVGIFGFQPVDLVKRFESGVID